MAKSGRLGLSAFLPPPDTFIIPDLSKAKLSPKEREYRVSDVPMLPMTMRWWLTDFSVHSVVAPYTDANRAAPIDVRQWVMEALQRYRFVIGEMPFAHGLSLPVLISCG